MKKLLLSLVAASLCATVMAQQPVKITFENDAIGTTGGATAMWAGGTVEVIANTFTTGNSSGKVLRVNNTNYLPIHFDNVAFPAGAETMYSILKLKILMVGGTDTNYPTLEIFSSPNNSSAGATEKIGSLGWQSLWGNAEIGVWKTVEFTLATSLIKPIPDGKLVLKLVKSSCEYLLDDIELVPVPAAGNIFTVSDFESNTLNEVLAMRRYSPTDATATVVASPTDANNKVVHVVANNWNSAVRFNVALPTGKEMANYENLSFDIYLNNIEGSDNGWKNIEGYIGDTKVIDRQSQGLANAWETKSYAIENLAGGNAFVFDLGLNTNKGNYYLDNIKLRLASTTGLIEKSADALFVYSNGNAFVMNQKVDAYVLYNALGAAVASGTNKSEISTLNLSNGIYILQAQIGSETYKTKLIR